MAPTRPSSCRALAALDGEAGIEPVEAVRLAKHAVDMTGGPYSWYVYGVCLWRKGRLWGAICAIEHALDWRPAETMWLWRLGCLWREYGDMKKAREAWDAGLKINPRNRFILKELGKPELPQSSPINRIRN